MTVAELIEKLRGFPAGSTVFANIQETETTLDVEDVSPSEDAPAEEVYIELSI